VIDAFAVRRIHLVAHSMGGTIALLLPPRTLARFESLILVEPRLMKSSCGIAAETALGDIRHFASDVLPAFRQRVSRDAQTSFDLGRADIKAFYEGACSLIEHTQGDEMLQRFRSVPCNKAFVYGGLNQHLEELRLIDEKFQFEVPDAGHFTMYDEPQVFYRLLSELISNSDL